jgi:hypothetical protein
MPMPPAFQPLGMFMKLDQVVPSFPMNHLGQSVLLNVLEAEEEEAEREAFVDASKTTKM